jgi:tRNA dimethylallyltransferase
VTETPKLLVITGPTASGKSAVAHFLAKRLSGEIVNADSVQIYRGFDIGSAKPSSQEILDYKYHLVSELDPMVEFNAGRFEKRATVAIDEILSQGNLPIVVGGTGLYIRALLCGLIDAPEAEDKVVKYLSELEQARLDAGSTREQVANYFYQMLVELDAETAKELLPSDYQRIIRALTVKLQTGASLKSLWTEHALGVNNKYDVLILSLLPSRESLHQSIEKRVKLMIEQGLIGEVKNLLETFDASCKPFSAIGYREVKEFVNGNISLEEMSKQIITNTKRFAKRQVTWWRHQPSKLNWELLPEKQYAFESLESLGGQLEKDILALWTGELAKSQHPRTRYLAVNLNGLVE